VKSPVSFFPRIIREFEDNDEPMIYGGNKMGIVVTLIGVIVLLSIVSTIYVDNNSELTIENAKEFGHKILDTVKLWRV